MKYLQLHFRSRTEWLSLPLNDDAFSRARDAFADRRNEPHFMEYETLYGQSVWLNGAHLQIVRFLFETKIPPFTSSALKPSVQDQFTGGSDVDLAEVRWEVLVWIAGRDQPLRISDLSGHDWIEITTAVQDRIFFFVTDEDGEKLAVRVSDVDLVVGTEVARYSKDQLTAALNEIQSERKPA